MTAEPPLCTTTPHVSILVTTSTSMSSRYRSASACDADMHCRGDPRQPQPPQPTSAPPVSNRNTAHATSQTLSVHTITEVAAMPWRFGDKRQQATHKSTQRPTTSTTSVTHNDGVVLPRDTHSSFTCITQTDHQCPTFRGATIPEAEPARKPGKPKKATTTTTKLGSVPREFAALQDPHPPDHATTTPTYK